MLKDFKAFQIAKSVHKLCKSLKVSYYLQGQFLRASSSIALNIAEGSGKRTPSDQSRFYSIALGSLREVAAIIELEEIKNPELDKLLDQLGAILYSFSRKKTKNRTRAETATETDV